jgi:hypothetical protein
MALAAPFILEDEDPEDYYEERMWAAAEVWLAQGFAFDDGPEPREREEV